jgi:tetratricopeptide (TPR) repeat protein
MSKQSLICVAALWLVASAAWAADVVKVTQTSMSGQVTEMNAFEVTLEQGNSTRKIQVNDIEAIYYDEEPTAMKTARTAIDAGRYEDALTALEKINVNEIQRAEIKQDVEFYKALASARIALASNSKIVEAGKMMVAFVRAYSNNYHYLQGCEIVGDLVVADGKYAAAQQFYGELAKAPWPDYKMRANVAIGWAALAEGKVDDAAKAFQIVLDTDAKGDLADRQKLTATLGKARCLAEAKKTDEAIKLVEGIIAKTEPEQVELQAQAYNTLGAAYRKAGRAKDAALAFLHTDTLYYTVPKYHIEALENLAQLWDELQRPERVAEVNRVLGERYNRSAN